MTVIRPIPVSPAALQTLAGQTAPQTPAATPQAIAAQSAIAEQKAMLFAVLQQALGEAAPRQNGLAPLMADAEAMLAQQDASLPQNVKTALQDLLATRLPGQAGVDAARLQNAVRQSGLFLESGLAQGQPVQGDLKAALLGLRQALQIWLGPQSGQAANATAPLPNATPNVAPNTAQAQPVPQAQPAALPQTTPSGVAMPRQAVPSVPSTPLRDAALRLLAETDAMLERPFAQPVGTTSTPLKANLDAILMRHGASLPQPVRDAIETVLGQRSALSAATSADALKAPTILPTPLLAGDGLMQMPAGDLKMALLALRQALENWLGPKPSTVMPQPGSTSANTLPPPHRGAPTVPQPPALPAALEAMPLREAGLRLLAETDAALSRHIMLQIASLPDDPASPRSADNGQRLVLDIPLVTPQGTAIVQLRIEHEEKRNSKGKKASVWQAMFSIDVEPIGPVHARIAMIGDTANVSLFAERKDSAAALRESTELLAAGLSEAALEPGDILCATGAPATPVAAPGLFVDRAS